MLRQLMSGAAVAVMLFAAGPGLAQDFSAERLSAAIRHISSDAFRGRHSGSEGERMTLAWLQAQYEEMGLAPAGPDGQWLQIVDLKRYTPVEGSAWANWTGPDGVVHALTPGTDIVLRAVTNDGQAAIENAGVVFAGYGIVAPERDWDDYGDIDVTGKVVIVMGGEPDGDLFNGAYRTEYASNAYKADEAKRRGAVGVVTLSPDAAGSPAWTRATAASLRTRTMTPGAADTEFSGAINADVGHAMAMAAGLDGTTILPTLATGSFRAVALEGVTLSVDTEETIDILRTHNLLAKIEGVERPNETIVFSAHWDHVGVGVERDGVVSTTEDNIYNGAWDNASGTVGVVEMARQIKAARRPERTIVFAHMAAEELGLLGGYAYAADPVYPLETTVADINIDMLPLSGPTRDVPIFGYGQNTLEDQLQVLAAAEGRVVTDDNQPTAGLYYRSDHYPFARKGVPALMPWHGVDWDEGGREAGMAAWQARFAADYHKPSDEWSEDWDLRSAVENLTLLYRLTLELANSEDWPTWKPASEFGAVRARSDAARL